MSEVTFEQSAAASLRHRWVKVRRQALPPRIKRAFLPFVDGLIHSPRVGSGGILWECL